MTPLTTLTRDDAAATSGGQRPPRRTVMTSDGVALSVSDHCRSSAVTHTVVLLHGLCLTRQSWYRPAQHLRRGDIRVIQYDHRGHGRSGGAPLHTYTPDRLAQDLAEVLTALQVSGPLTLAGHSMGGIAALSYLSRPVDQQPVRPAGLVLVATAAGHLTEHGLGRLLALPGIDTAIGLAQHVPHILSEHLMRSLARPLCELVTHDKTISASLSQAFRSTPISTALGFLHSLKTFDQRDVLPTIAATTTVISGGADILTPPAHSEEMAAAISGATHIHLPNAGHMLLQEAASVVSTAILRTINLPEAIEQTSNPHALNDIATSA
ncbi:alpha/beta hydrolase [Mycolicibacterium fortuitum]|uniref:Alpha/beta hydrolase n=1 Tax=Mycolicibacterium septicum DSM 44393 TaxID=1341646 RepID=A0A7X6MVC1_9MYCO|nr:MULTISPECIES: alpha/beta hydrolase [Mycolicibacterium]MBX8690628.1 alpha/beta fold hydrolase [Mycobacterium sp. 20091114027_K0903767]MCP3811225.1 alpha/beta hydrolase [Mycobacteriaceae bacterium Msp059]NKZ14974.1 alpha/beta hydrolase [Mycolicibacterium septicum DSM 44393]